MGTLEGQRCGSGSAPFGRVVRKSGNLRLESRGRRLAAPRWIDWLPEPTIRAFCWHRKCWTTTYWRKWCDMGFDAISRSSTEEHLVRSVRFAHFALKHSHPSHADVSPGGNRGGRPFLR